MSTSSISEPIVILYKSKTCSHCTNLTNIWDDVTAALKSVYPKIRFYVLTCNDKTGAFNENIAPKSLIKYAKWFPMIFLVPGKIWDIAMANLGPKNPIEIKEGVQIMNAEWDDSKDDFRYAPKYDIRKPGEFARWLRVALENEDFKRVQTGTEVVIPTTTVPAKPIQPLLSGIVKPTNSNNNYALTENNQNNTRNNSMEPGFDICSMRIISRPR